MKSSDAMIMRISSDLLSTRRTLRAFKEMNFALIPDSQPLAPIDFTLYGDQSDPSPYPIPSNLPVETWPSETGGLTLQQWQQDVNAVGGDRHSIIVQPMPIRFIGIRIDWTCCASQRRAPERGSATRSICEMSANRIRMLQPGAGFLWETWLTLLNGSQWEAANGAKFDLKSNALRPATWTSGDAAGLPMFPALPRFDECERGEIEHALRIVVKRTRAEFIYPARHYASVPYSTDPNVPAMGQRLRLKSSFAIPGNWTRQEKALLTALKKYGALVADNGNFFSISVTPDNRWPSGCFDHLSTVGITNFEVIQSTGPSEGPRSPNPPGANAGPDRAASSGQPVTLQGSVTWTGLPTTNRWKLHSGAGTATFADATQTNTTVSFSAPGIYTLLLSADNGVHAVAYDAAVFTVTQDISATISRNGPDVLLNWSGGSAPFLIERTAALSPSDWQPLLTNSQSSATLPPSDPAGFFRVRAQGL